MTANSEFQFKNKYNLRQTNRSGPLRYLLSHVGHYKILMGLSIGIGILSSVFASMVPTLIGQVARLLSETPDNIEGLVFFCLLIVVFGLLGPLMDLGVQGTTELVANLVDRDARDELYQEMLAKEMTFHDKQAIGDLMARSSQDVRQLYFAINPGFSLVFQSLVGLLIPIIFIFLINAELVIIPILFVLSYVIVLRRYNKNLESVSWKQRISASKISSRLNEAISGMYIVRGASQQEQERNIFNKNVEEFKDHSITIGRIQARYYPLLLLGIATVLAFFHSMILLQRGTIDIGGVIAFLGLLQLLRFPTFINIFALVVLSMGMASARRILNLINEETNIDMNPDGNVSEIEGHIEFRDVTFGYNEDIPVVKNISFSVKPGQNVAIVGMTGAGKTTITKLLSRLYDPNIGEIFIDGINLKEWNLQSLRSQIGLVEQDVFLFSKSIKENIVLGSNATDEEVITAAKLAKAHTFISKYPDGYDTVIGERGITLSGGQRQRIAIARAILRNPKILILDDATSAIDSQTEDEINTAIKNVLSGRSGIMITHRISQIRRADIIILLDKGEIIGIGNHETLLRENKKYQSIFSTFDEFDLKTAIEQPVAPNPEVI